ncbi:hypothetical protein L596_001428 [Steinernema carpocapsae]|uniref:Uncharacterized protein n=1 Tax=Steinernema carpocapsae TaxID=34508 RepID=A0A4U8ULR4_STECR|nr:hypothetical protein L596_001428 [Steinernema carpocapsae]
MRIIRSGVVHNPCNPLGPILALSVPYKNLSLSFLSTMAHSFALIIVICFMVLFLAVATSSRGSILTDCDTTV